MERYESLFDPNAQQSLAKEANYNMIRTARDGMTLFLTGKRSIHAYEKSGKVKTGRSDVDQDAMYVLHGEYAQVLGNKHAFPGLVRDLGYKAPESYLLEVDKIPPEKRGEEVLNYYQNPARKANNKTVTLLFVKPLNGTWQRDLAAFDTTTNEGKEGLKAYLSKAEENTLIQELMPNRGNFRYMRYRTNNGKIYVACFKFFRDKSKDKKVKLPFIGKRIYSRAAGATYNRYLETLINLTAVPLGNDKHQLDNLNKFMEGFMSALETRLGGQIPLLSVDIGIEDFEKLEGNYDEATMRKNIIFFETQTLPMSWEYRQHNIPHPIKTYINLGKMFMKEHGDGVLVRARNLRNNYKKNQS